MGEECLWVDIANVMMELMMMAHIINAKIAIIHGSDCFILKLYFLQSLHKNDVYDSCSQENNKDYCKQCNNVKFRVLLSTAPS